MGGGRRWLMANLNKRLMKESVYPMHEFFWDSNLPVSLNELIVPYPMRTRTQNLMEKYPELAHRSSSPKSTLLQLPNEILLEIYRHVDAILDAASLALVDGRLFAVSWQRLDELHRLQYGNWAGDQIICLGKSTKVDDLPKSVTAVWEEQAEWMERLEIEVGPDRGDPDELDDPLQQANNNHVDRDSSGSGDGDSSGSEDGDSSGSEDGVSSGSEDGVSSGYEDEDDGSDADSWNMESHITQVDDPEERKAPYRRIRWYYTSPKGDDSLWDSRRRYDSKAFRELLQPETPKPHEQVLCNISKGQYVRADAMPKRDNGRYGRGAYTNDYKIGLSQALLSQIMWSSSPRETSIVYRWIEPDPIWRGKWAGDRIEVTTLDRLRPGIKWRDVSKKTVDRLANLMLRAESLRNPYQY